MIWWEGGGWVRRFCLNPFHLQNPQTFTDALVALHHHFTGLLAEAFENDHQFMEALDKAFRIVVNVKFQGGKGSAKVRLS